MSNQKILAWGRRSRWLGLALMLSYGVCALTDATLDAPTALATEAEKNPEQVIREMVDAVFVILRDPALAKEPTRRMQALRKVVDQAFDWQAMAQSSLGPAWRKLGDKQRAEFVEVFKELLARQYMDDIDRFQGTEQVSLTGSEKSGDLVIVKTVLSTSSREQVPMSYTLRAPAGPWRVEDLSIEGVSLVNHYRKTFARFLVNKTFEELLAQLKRKLSQP